MRKADLEIGGEYAWQHEHEIRDEYRRVTLVQFLPGGGGKRVLVRDADGEFETSTTRLLRPWADLGPNAKDARFRTPAERIAHQEREEQERDPKGYEIRQLFRNSTFEPGRGGVPRVPYWLPRKFDDLSRGVLKLELGRGRREDEQLACYRMLQTLWEVCERIRSEVHKSGLVEALVEEEKTCLGTIWSEIVKRRLEDGELPFSSSDIMPVFDGRMTRSAASTQHTTGSAAVAEFMLQVADDYEEIDRYGSIAVEWARGLYFRHRESQERQTAYDVRARYRQRRRR